MREDNGRRDAVCCRNEEELAESGGGGAPVQACNQNRFPVVPTAL